MNTENTYDIDDVGEAIREGRDLRSAHAYRILFAQENLTFRAIEVNDPVPLGRQILVAAGLRAHEDYSLFAILETCALTNPSIYEVTALSALWPSRPIAISN